MTLVADDLTGACDAGVHFALHGCSTRVRFWRSNEELTRDVEVIDLASRTLPASEAGDRLRTTLVQGGTRPVFLKVDSLLRGNHVQDARDVIEWLQPRLVLFSPALPAQERIVANGELLVHGKKLCDLREVFSAFKCESLRLEHLKNEEAAKRHLGQLSATARFVLADATEQRHLDIAVNAAFSLDPNTLWMGSSGLAKSVARAITGHDVHAPANLPVDGRPVLFGVGSRHPVTLQQLEHLSQRASSRAVLLDLPRGFRKSYLDDFFRERPLTGFSAAFLSGGDTAIRFLQCLDATGIDLIGEVQPGAPWGRVLGGSAHGMVVVTKSGAFGRPACFAECLVTMKSSAVMANEISA